MPSGITSLPMPSPGMTAIFIALDLAAAVAIPHSSSRAAPSPGSARLLLDRRGRFFHAAIIPGFAGLDAGGPDLLVKLLEELERALLALGADDTILGIDLHIGLDRHRIERLVPQPMVRRQGCVGGLGCRLFQPFWRLVEGIGERLPRVGFLPQPVALDVEHR